MNLDAHYFVDGTLYFTDEHGVVYYPDDIIWENDMPMRSKNAEEKEIISWREMRKGDEILWAKNENYFIPFVELL